jgi:hypothetical protein
MWGTTGAIRSPVSRDVCPNHILTLGNTLLTNWSKNVVDVDSAYHALFYHA